MKNTLHTLYICILLCLDLVSKYVFYDLQLFSEYVLFSPALNVWVAWSMPMPQLVTILLSAGVMIYICYLLYTRSYIQVMHDVVWWQELSEREEKSIYTDMWSKTLYIEMALIMLLAWWLWNLVDRIYIWWVRDFIDINIWYLSGLWRPIFNMADIYITFWAIVLVLFVWFGSHATQS